MTSKIDNLLTELDWEAEKTKKTLNNIPEDQFGWSPHEKSRPINSLAGHIAELPGWLPFVLNHDELNFADGVTFLGHHFENKKDLMTFFQETQQKAKAALQDAKDEDLDLPWTIRSGDTILVQATKGEILRRMCFNHLVHHRSQLGVYLRLLNQPVPATYGPSADEQGF